MRAIASRMLVGSRCSIKLRIVIAPATMPEVESAGGSCRVVMRPGCSSSTSASPRTSEITEATMNSARVCPPMRPMVAMSPIFAMPATRVVNTSGAMIILIRRRNAKGRRSAPSAKSFARAGSSVTWTP